MRITLFKTWLVFFLVIVSIPVSLKAQQRLELSLRTDKAELVLGEPVIIYVSLKNIGTTPVEVMRFLEPDYGFVEYKSKGPDGKVLSFLAWAHKDHPAPQQTLSKGEVISKEAKIFFGGNGWTFLKAGSYEIWAVYMSTITSNRITIEVLLPAEEPAKKAADLFLKSEEVGYFLLFEGGDHLKDGMQRIEQVATQFSTTPHAIYANYALGTNLLRDFADFEKNRLRKAEPRRAIAFLLKAKGRPVSFYYMMHTHLSLIEGYEKIGDIRRAETIRNDLERVTSEQFQDFRPLLDDILKRK